MCYSSSICNCIFADGTASKSQRKGESILTYNTYNPTLRLTYCIILVPDSQWMSPIPFGFNVRHFCMVNCSIDTIYTTTYRDDRKQLGTETFTTIDHLNSEI